MGGTDRRGSGKGLRFPGVKALEAWLRTSAAGNEIVGRLLERRCAACERVQEADARCLVCDKRPAVLVVIDPSGRAPAVDVYADRKTDVRVVEMLDVDDAAWLAAEEYMEATLPERYRVLYLPWNNRGHKVIEYRTPSEERMVRDRVAALAEIQRGLSEKIERRAKGGSDEAK